ncbi:MAG: hypothetical protein PV340_02125 [Wolbachia sp.]|nr:hypothetical protein [Wolbachia sp.]MDD9336224.1 hypothetical protein [Wolbachia sp.]
MGVCQKRQKILEDKCLELNSKKESSIDKEEFLRLKNIVAELQESQRWNLKERESIVGSRLEISHSDRLLTE